MASEFASDPGWKFLRESSEDSIKAQANRPFDNTTHRWIADAEEGFIPVPIKGDKGDNYTLQMPDGNVKTLPKKDCQEINPTKYEKTEDMANLTFLNEASVLHNLKMRYKSMIIYTYSGLFCVFINPYKLLPIYSDSVAAMYINRRRTEMPPHLFAVADQAFRNMLHEKKNQSMLITGESGAGKTENTKKVISYFARIGGSSASTERKGEASLEDQVVQANPAIEAFGNGATVRNYNSSRFGKFIRIHFDTKGKLVGGDIEYYLLEKSRVIKQAPGERSYHIFYQIMTQKNLREKYLLEEDIHKYSFVSQAEVTVPGMDDNEEWKTTDNAFDVMKFTAAEKSDLYKLCAAIMHMGEMRFKQKPRDEQAEIEDMKAAQLASKLFCVDPEIFVLSLLRPKVKVGAEWVAKGQNQQQVEWAVGALAKAIYARLFTWLIKRCNRTLQGAQELAAFYIGVLDIAGFEIFDRNSFEQLWINFVNEKLQQFFNHHMFVLEQEEYKREGIEWTFIDFGLDLQSCIDLIEKPLGIVSMLDEECIVPKASDMTYVDKLLTQHLGKHPNYQKAKPPKGKQAEAHFAIVHYAGLVRYNAEQWLDKNKDPLNDTVVACLKTSDHAGLLYAIWDDYKTAIDREDDALRGKASGGRKGKAASFMTVSTMYRESLSSLMAMLHSTQPHFIRCIIPNEKKQSGVIDAPLVLNQLTCNGVLEGIRICRKGFPNRMLYDEFRYRYAILAAEEGRERNPKKASEAMLKKLVDTDTINVDSFKTGLNKVFFRAGMLARMEELRDEAISKMLLAFQCRIRWFLAQKEYKRLTMGDEMSALLQYNVRQWNKIHSWSWWRLFLKLKPMLKGMRPRAEVEMLEKRLKEVEDTAAAAEEERKKLAEELSKRNNELDDVKGALDRERAAAARKKKDIEDLNKSLREEQEKAELLAWQAKETEKEREKEKREWEDRMNLAKSEADRAAAQSMSEKEALKRQMTELNRQIEAMAAAKKAQEMANVALQDKLEQAALKEERMMEMQDKLKEDVNAAEEKVLQEKKLKEDALRAKKRMEAEVNRLAEQLLMLKNQQAAMDAEHKRRDFELSELKQKGVADANLIVKLQMHIRQLITRIEELEDELDNEIKLRIRFDRQRTEMQSELEGLHEKVAETGGQLTAQQHLNKERGESLSVLQRELQKRSLANETCIADLCSMQYATLHNLRNLSAQAKILESDAMRVLETRKSQQLYKKNSFESDEE